MMKPRIVSTLRGATLVLVAFVGFVPTSEATVPCLKPDPKTCKIPEDCMVKRQIAMKRAFRDAFASSAMRCKAMTAAKKALGKGATPAALSKQAAALLYQDIANNPGRVAKKLDPCKKSKLADPPGWSTGDDCVFSASVNDPNSVNTCSEFLNASRTHERNHAASCRAVKKNEKTKLGEVSSWVDHGAACDAARYNQGVEKVPNRDDLNDFADEEADSYTLEIWELEDERAAAIHRCTTARDAAKAAEAVSKNAKALLATTGGAR